MTTQTMEFQAETRQLLDLMIHSLYRHKEIFLRELISNASDALDKVRFEALTRPELLEGDDDLAIRLETDRDARTLTIADNGIGMSRDEVIENLGTIARSGTREFVAALKDAKEQATSAPELIGQFGVGFYSAFMVADRVTVETRRADLPAGEGVRWTSTGGGAFELETIERAPRGTRITLHLKERGEEGEEMPELTAEWALRGLVKKYSDFVQWPIRMDVEREEGEGDDKKTVVKTETLNSMKPLWTRTPSEVTDEEHAEFYKQLAHDWEPPGRTIHFRAEGTLEYTALLYVPSHRPLAFLEGDRGKSKLSLYVKRVFIMDDCDELLPPWLRFVRGLVDSSDLPLNVSRETLQHTRQMAPIRRRLVTKTLETFKKWLDDDRDAYAKTWGEFGPLIKEGMYGEDDETKFKIAEVCLFRSTRGDGLVTLDEVIEAMPDGQEEVYWLAGPDLDTLRRSPHLEAFAARGYEVLLLTDPVDEFAMQRLTEFDGKPLKAIDKGDVDLGDDEEKAARDEKAKELKPLLDAVKERLGEQVAEVRFSSRLKESPAVLVTGEQDLSPHMARLLRGMDREVPESKRILELNASHPLVKRLDALRDGSAGRFGDYCELLFGQAQLAEGTAPEDPQRFNRLLTSLMVGEDRPDDE